MSHFENEPNRMDYAGLQWEDFYVDISKNRLDKKGFDLLIELAKESELIAAIEAQFSGCKNQCYRESSSFTYSAKSHLKKKPILVDGKEIHPTIEAAQNKMYAFCEEVISGRWKGYSGKSITHIVNIGIGGSDLGPAMVVEALAHYQNHLEFVLFPM